jgi:hypothetical protein
MYATRSCLVPQVSIGLGWGIPQGRRRNHERRAVSRRVGVSNFSRRFGASSAHAGLVFANHYRHHRDSRRHGHRQFHRARPGRPTLHVRRTFLEPDKVIGFLLRIRRTRQRSCSAGQLRDAESAAPSIKHEADGFRGWVVVQIISEPIRSVTDREQDLDKVTLRQWDAPHTGFSPRADVADRLVRKRASRPGSGCPTRARRNASRRTLCRMGDVIMQEAKRAGIRFLCAEFRRTAESNRRIEGYTEQLHWA